MSDVRLIDIFCAVFSLVKFADGGDFEQSFDVLVRLWCSVAYCDHPHALMRGAAEALAAQALVMAVDAHGIGVPRKWREDVTARVTLRPPAEALAELTRAVIALGELRPARRRLDPARADAAADVAAAAVALGLAWYNDAPAPPWQRLAAGAPLEAS